MGLVNKTTVNFISEQGKKLDKYLSAKPVVAANIERLEYMPKQLSADVVEITHKTLPQAEIAIEAATLQELASKGLSLNEIASKLSIPMSKVRLYLQKHNIITDAQKEFRILKDYFTASTREDKAKAFVEIDKYLEQIAKEEFKLQKRQSYEDCLQDVRLKFFELAGQSQKDGLTFSTSIFQKLRKSQPAIKEEMQTISLEGTAIAKADRLVNDFHTENFEFRNYLMQLLKSNRSISQREKQLIKAYIEDEKSVVELASSCGVGRERMRQILKDKILPKLKIQYNKTSSNEYLQQKAESAVKYINKIDVFADSVHYRTIDGNYVIKNSW